MSKPDLFEAAWREGYESFERVFVPHLGKSVKRKIDKANEYFVPSNIGNYRYALDRDIILDKRFGSYKDGADEFGFQGAINHHIRDTYWETDVTKARYNLKPNLWYLDIETRVGQSFKHNVRPEQVKIRANNDTNNEEGTEMCVLEARELFKETRDMQRYQYYDKTLQVWKPLRQAHYMERNTGFPVPDKALEEISMFQILDTRTNVMFLLGVKDWIHQERYLKYGDNARYDDFEKYSEVDLPFEVRYMDCGNEVNLIKTFLAMIKRLDPLVVLAWNGAGFDYPYIHNRMKNLGMDVKELSNYGGVSYSEKEFQGMKEFRVEVDGAFWMDLKDVYMKFDFGTHSSYSLDNIAWDELQDRKVNHTEYTTFDDFYTGNYTLPENPTEEQARMSSYLAAKAGRTRDMLDYGYSEFVWYGLKDTWLLQRIDDKRKFTDTMILIASMTGAQMTDTLGTVRVWGQYLSNLLMHENLVMPKREEHEKPRVVGGHVADPVKGRHEWVVSIDVSSMYPLLGMVSFNMSPETYIQPYDVPPELQDIIRTYYSTQEEENIINLPQEVKDTVTELLQKHKIGLGINGACFSQEEEGIVARTVRDIYLKRKDKQKELRAYQTERIKIQEVLRQRELKNE